MFRIVCIVEDKNLPHVLHGLAGKVVHMEPPQPVTNAVKTKNGLKAAGSGSLADTLLAHLHSTKATRVTTGEARDFAEKQGRASVSAYQALGVLVEQKNLKRTKPGQYEVLQKKG